MSGEATSEEIVQAKQSLEAGHPLPIGLQAKLLARLERVEEELRALRREIGAEQVARRMTKIVQAELDKLPSEERARKLRAYLS